MGTIELYFQFFSFTTKKYSKQFFSDVEIEDIGEDIGEDNISPQVPLD